ncbi:MAG TPA: DUF3426 domain-containing protein [Alphaproteobacteria bacterium]
MIITCPECATRFSLDPSAIGPQGRKVRCSSCHHTWLQTLPAEAEAVAVGAGPGTLSFEERRAPEPVAAPAGASSASASIAAASASVAAEREARQAERGVRFQRPPIDTEDQHTIWPVLLAWLLFFAMVVAIVAGFYRFRQQFVDLWPPAVQLYELFDIDVVPPPGYGLRIEVGEQSRVVEDGASVLVIKGTVANVSDRPRQVARIQGTMFDAAGRPTQSWDFAPNKEILAAGETIAFETRVKNPAPTATRFELNFVPD